MSDLAEHLILEADGLFDSWRLDEAREKYEEALKYIPGDRHALNRVARIHAIRGRIKELVKTCFQWQEALETEGNWEIAATVAGAILRFDPQSLDARLSMLRHLEKTGQSQGYIELARRDARFFMEVGSGELSIQVLEQALAVYPEDIDLSVDLADMHVAQGHLQDAVIQFRKLASKFEAVGNSSRAVDAYRRLKLLLPESPDVSMRLGTIHMAEGRFDDAIAEFRAVLRYNLAHRDALIGLGDASLKKGAHRDAMLAYRKVLAVDPRDMEAHEHLAEVCLAQGMVQEAVKELLAAGLMALEFQEYDRAQELYGRVLEIEPEHPTAIRELSNARSAAAQEEERRKAAEVVAKGAHEPGPAPAAPAISEDELYAPPPPSHEELYAVALDNGPFEILGAPSDDADLLVGAPVEPTNGAPVRKPITRVLVEAADAGQLQKPTPLLFLSRPDLLAAIRDQIEEPPDPERLPWQPLAELDRPSWEVAAPVAAQATPAQQAPTPRFGGPVQSAFGTTGGFSQAFASGGNASYRSSRRRGWEFLPSGRGPRSEPPGPAEPDGPGSLADRISRKARDEDETAEE